MLLTGRAGYCTSIKDNEVGPAIWGEWLTPALAKGLMKCFPAPEIVGSGLEYIEEGCKRIAKGVSATKLVVEIP